MKTGRAPGPIAYKKRANIARRINCGACYIYARNKEDRAHVATGRARSAYSMGRDAVIYSALLLYLIRAKKQLQRFINSARFNTYIYAQKLRRSFNAL